MPGITLDVAKGITVVPEEARQEGTAVLKMPDGSSIDLPVLVDSAKFVDVRKLQPT